METRHSGRRRKGWREEGRQSGGRKRGSGPRTKLKSRGRNSSDLKRYSISRGASIDKAVFDEAEGKQHNITEVAPNELKLGEGG